MWAGTAAFLLQYPGYRGSGVGQLEPDQFHYYITRVKKLSSLELLAGARLILVIGHTIVLALGYLFARQLIGLGPALMTFMFIAFDPFHLALTRVFHLDGLSSNLVFLALLAFLHYLRRNSLLSLLVSGIAAGLGWLTKSPALLLIPVVGVLALVDFWKRLTFSTTGNLWQLIRRAAWPVMLWAGLGMLVFVAFWPAMWIDPANTLLLVLSRAQRYAEQGHFASMFFKGVVYEQGRIGPQFVEFYPLTFLWRTTPIILLGILLALPGGWLRVRAISGAQHTPDAFWGHLAHWNIRNGIDSQRENGGSISIAGFPPCQPDCRVGMGRAVLLQGWRQSRAVSVTCWDSSRACHPGGFISELPPVLFHLLQSNHGRQPKSS